MNWRQGNGTGSELEQHLEEKARLIRQHIIRMTQAASQGTPEDRYRRWKF